MPDYSTTPDTDSQRQKLNAPPPRPPKNNKNLMQMGSNAPEDEMSMDMSNPAVMVMQLLGDIRQDFMKLATYLPGLAQAAQQIIQGLESVVPQQVADLVAGVPPGSSGSGMGAPQAAAAPTAPPVQAGMP